MKDLILHPHFTGRVDGLVLRDMIQAGFAAIGPPVHHLVIPSRGRPEFDAQISNLGSLRAFVQGRKAIISRAEPGSFIQINFEPGKGGGGPAYEQYQRGRPDLPWFACAATVVDALRCSEDLAPGVGVCLYAALRAPAGTDYIGVNDQLFPLFDSLDLVTASRYCVGPEFDPYPDIMRLGDCAHRLGLVDRLALQVWTVLRNHQTQPISEWQAEQYVRGIRDSGIRRIIGYVESQTDAQTAAEAAGWRILGDAIKRNAA